MKPWSQKTLCWSATTGPPGALIVGTSSCVQNVVTVLRTVARPSARLCAIALTALVAPSATPPPAPLHTSLTTGSEQTPAIYELTPDHETKPARSLIVCTVLALLPSGRSCNFQSPSSQSTVFVATWYWPLLGKRTTIWMTATDDV